jgi:hypothetical protein
VRIFGSQLRGSSVHEIRTLQLGDFHHSLLTNLTFYTSSKHIQTNKQQRIMYFPNLFPLFLLASSIAPALGHGRMTRPSSRNDYAWRLGKEFNQNGLNTKTNGGCGLVEGKNYDLPPADVGWRTQAVYNPGAEIDVEVALTAHHWGHFEFFGCPIGQGQTASESCFNQYPLEFVRDLRFNAPKDPNYPRRAYIPPASMGLNYLYKLKLPSNLSGSIVLIQWRYTTGNSCKSAGYDQYPWPSSWTGVPLRLSPCTPGVPPFAEMFWNCAEVSIGSGGGGSPPPPPSGGGGTCGNGSRGNGVCADNTCCSSFGWCGTSSLHCGTAPPPTVGTCGGGNRGNGRCADSNLCCSQWGWCGTSTAHCGRRNLRETNSTMVVENVDYFEEEVLDAVAPL